MKKIVILLCIVLVCILLFFVKINFDYMKQTKESAIEFAERWVDSIIFSDFDSAREIIKNSDGKDLSDEQMTNFLLNTDLFRLISFEEKVQLLECTSKSNFFNYNEGNVIFSFKAVDGDIITNEIKYIHNGANEYLVTDMIGTSNKRKIKYPFASNLANGQNLINENKTDNESLNFGLIGGYGVDESENCYFEIIEDSIDDIKINTLNLLLDARTSLKKINDNYNIEWDDEYKVFSIYYEENIELNNPLVYLKVYGSSYNTSLLMQCLSGNEDWKLTINFYDFNTKELIKTEKIR